MPDELNIETSTIGHNTAKLLNLSGETKLTRDFIFEEIIIDDDNRKRLLALSMKHKWTLSDFIQWLRNNPEDPIGRGYDIELGQHYIDNQKKHGVQNWYEWRYNNWGTKWNADTLYFDENFCLSDKSTSFYVDFNTAWCPPDEWIKTLISCFPDAHIELTYFEPGCLFGGIISSDDDKCCYYQYPETEDELWTIAEEFGYSKEDFV